MRDRLIFTGQFIFTLLVAAFLVVPAGLSISAGVTVNYFRGIQSGVTLQWVAQVWELYAGTILLVLRDRVRDTRASRCSSAFRAATRCMRGEAGAHRRGDNHAAAGDSRARDRAGAAARLRQLR